MIIDAQRLGHHESPFGEVEQCSLPALAGAGVSVAGDLGDDVDTVAAIANGAPFAG